MKHLNISYILILALLFPWNLGAQNDMDPAGTSIPSLPGTINEKIELFTDRSIYAVGENIFFSAFLYNPTGQASTCWSRVIYLDLVTPDGTSVARGKYPSDCTHAEGYITVPEQLLTGNYYLVAYTRWMLNYSPLHYTYSLVKIINPFTPQLEPSCLQGGSMIPYASEVEVNSIEEVIVCTTDRSRYQAGEQARLSVRLPETIQPLASQFTVTAGSPVIMDSLSQNIVRPDSTDYQSTESIRYLPDLMGLSISGKVFQAGSTEPVSNVLVEISILGQDPHFLSCLSEDDGSFCFALDSMTGRHELVIAARAPDDRDLEIRVDNDFTPANFSFAPRPFILSDSEKEEATRIMLNMQIRKSYEVGSSNAAISAIPDKGNFYGKPTSRILIDEYIELPNLQEVVIELLPEVHYRTQNGKASLQFAGNTITRSIIGNFVPLVLIDQLPIYDLEKLLEHSPRNLYSIDVVNELYMVGNNTYGGIFSVISEKGDLAGIDLPENSFFFDFTTYQPQSSTAYSQIAGGEGEVPVPDLRNTLFWEPGLELVPGQASEVVFNAPERPGRYQVMIRGLSADGNVLQGRCAIIIE
jgi:hypothetical protein